MMKRTVALTLLMIAAAGTAHASLEIYTDGVKYRYIPVDEYVGFVRDAKARCGEREIAVFPRAECPEAKRLCKERVELEKLRMELGTVRESIKMLEGWSRAAKPAEVDAAKWIGAAEKLGKRQAEWRERERRVAKSLESGERHFRSQVSSEDPHFLSRRCKDEIELTLPAGVIDVSLLNVADLEKEKIRISRFLSLRNHSGVDLSSKDLRIYARRLHRMLRPVAFRPWVVRPAEQISEAAAPMPLVAFARTGKAKMADEKREDSVPQRSARRLGYRNYAVGSIELPSTGEEVRIRIDGYEVPRRCEEISFPWRDLSAYIACRFNPKEAVEENRWILREGRRVVSEEAYGEYEEGKYLLFVDRDDEVEIRREGLVDRERSSGIFGGKIRKKDGYRLIFVNKSDRQKTLKVIERIPTSATEKIKVKLLKLEGAVEESLDENGRLVMQVILPPKSEKEVKVLFELNYDKGMKVRY
jgi:hypothetical protein